MNFTKVYKNKDYIFIPKEESQVLLVSFAPHGLHDKNGIIRDKGHQFFKLNTLSKNPESNLLFINNKNNWYLEKDQGKEYQELLQPYVSKFGAPNVTFFGSSMGAYGAIYHAILLGANAIAVNPQVSTGECMKHGQPHPVHNSLYSSLARLDPLVEISEMYQKKQNDIQSTIYLMIGDSALDRGNLSCFLNTIPDNIKYVVEKLKYSSHDYYIHNSRDLYDRVEILRHLRGLTTSYNRDL
jgi:hypothetical protein